MKLPVLAALSLSAATPAGAATIHVETTTEVGTGSFGTLAPLFTTGETVRIRYSYDDSVPDEDPAAGEGSFHGSVIGLSAEFLDSGLSYVFGEPFTLITTTDNNNDISDSFAVGATTFLGGDLLGGATPCCAIAAFQTVASPGPPILVVNERPSPPPFSYSSGALTLATSSGNAILILVGGDGVAGVPVPEPGTTALLGALAGLGVLRRIRTQR